MYVLFLIFATLFVVCGWTLGTGLLLLSLAAPRIPRSWVWSGVRHIRGHLLVAGLVLVLVATVVFVSVDLMVPASLDPPAPCVWASGNDYGAIEGEQGEENKTRRVAPFVPIG